jgi:superfamily II DNA or RNA helicase
MVKRGGLFRCRKCNSYYLVDGSRLIAHDLDKALSKDIPDVVQENCGKELRAVQRRFFEEIKDMAEKSGKAKGIISLPTGVGKTLLAACLLRYLIKSRKIAGDQHVLVLAPRTVILDQITDRKSDFYNVFRDVPVPIKEVEDDDTKSEHLLKLLGKGETQIIVATPQLIERVFGSPKQGKNKVLEILYKMLPPSERLQFMDIEKDHSRAMEKVGTIKALILDEVHHTYNGSKVSKAIKPFVENCNFVLGMSATPTKESVHNVGAILGYYNIRDAMREGVLVNRIKFYKYDTIIREAKIIDTGEKCDPWRVAIEERAEKYVDKILEVIDKERAETGQDRILKTAIACPNVTEADIFYGSLENRLGQKGKSLYKVHYQVEGTEKELKKELEKFKEDREGILVCVNMIDIGFDDRDLEMLVLAKKLRSPISYVQLRGRVLRTSIHEWNIKKIKNYAIILDLAGNVERYQRESEMVSKGEVEAEGFESDLKGEGKVKKATANVKLKEEGREVWPPKESISQATPIPKTKTAKTAEIIISKGIIENDPEHKNIIDRLHRCFDEGYRVYLISDLDYAKFIEVCHSLKKKFVIDCGKICYHDGMKTVEVERRE